MAKEFPVASIGTIRRSSRNNNSGPKRANARPDRVLVRMKAMGISTRYKDTKKPDLGLDIET